MVGPRLEDGTREHNDMKPGLALLRRPDCALAFGFGVGLMPWMPGTFGALLALPLCWLLLGLSMPVIVMLLAGAVALGIAVSASTSRLLGVDDHGAIVWDEVCGAAIVLISVPATALWWVSAFLLFRVLDILKPWPIGVIERRLKGGAGVMMDDVAAGLIAALLLWTVRAILPTQ
jgi:phosphatidylglycerophosphatase A